MLQTRPKMQQRVRLQKLSEPSVSIHPDGGQTTQAEVTVAQTKLRGTMFTYNHEFGCRFCHLSPPPLPTRLSPCGIPSLALSTQQQPAGQLSSTSALVNESMPRSGLNMEVSSSMAVQLRNAYTSLKPVASLRMCACSSMHPIWRGSQTRRMRLLPPRPSRLRSMPRLMPSNA